uniref:Otoancorin n=1 Tax=Eptatretus burgeri TaxID=7764 RepID=A0A8C4NMK7_EPTBU
MSTTAVTRTASPQTGTTTSPQTGNMTSPQTGTTTSPQTGNMTSPQTGTTTSPQSGISTSPQTESSTLLQSQSTGTLTTPATQSTIPNANIAQIIENISNVTTAEVLNLTNRAVIDNIKQLGKSDEWTETNAQVLMDKYLEGGAKVSTAEEVINLGSLIQSVPSDMFSEMSSDQMEKSLPTLSNRSSLLDDVQRSSIMRNALTSIGINQTVNIISGPLVSAIPLNSLYSLKTITSTTFERKSWTQSQSSYLVQKFVSNQNSININKIRAMDQAVIGMTCDMIEKVDKADWIEAANIMTKMDTFSSTKVKCLGTAIHGTLNFEKIKKEKLESIPPSVLAMFPMTDINKIPDTHCSSLVHLLGQVRLNLLPKISQKRTDFVNRAWSCAKSNSNLVKQLGSLVCDLTATRIDSLTKDQFSALISKFKSCGTFDPDKRVAVAGLIKKVFGSTSQWVATTVEGLGPLVSTLDREDLDQLPIRSDIADKLVEIIDNEEMNAATVNPNFDFSWNVENLYDVTYYMLRGGARRFRRDIETNCTSINFSVDMIKKMKELNFKWKSDELSSCMTSTIFLETLDTLNVVTKFDQIQHTILLMKAKKAFKLKTVEDFTAWKFKALGLIKKGFSVQELKRLRLNTDTILLNFGKVKNWENSQGRTIVQQFRNGLCLLPNKINGKQLFAFNNLLCFLNPVQVAQVNKAAFSEAMNKIGKITCGTPLLVAWKNKAVETFGPVTSWTNSLLQGLQNIVAGCSAAELKAINDTRLSSISSLAIPFIPPEVLKELSVAELKALGFANLGSITEEQRKMLNSQQLNVLEEVLDTRLTSHAGKIATSSFSYQ